jgi:hypothetical protein
MNSFWTVILGVCLFLLSARGLLAAPHQDPRPGDDPGVAAAEQPPPPAAEKAPNVGLRESLERLRKAVQENGWQLLFVTSETKDEPAFVYTTGLWKSYKHPEILVFSPTKDPRTLGGVLSALAKRVAAGERFEPGKTYPDVFGKHSGAFRTVHGERYPDYLGTAGAFYSTFDFPALQLFWPDDGGRFPWDAEFNKNFASLQPLLSRVP